MRATFTIAAGLLVAASSLGCNRAGPGAPAARTQSSTTERTTTTTQTTPNANDRMANGGANVDVGTPRDRTTAPLAGPTNSGVNVDVSPGGGVDVDVQGQPIRDRIRERRAARDTVPPR